MKPIGFKFVSPAIGRQLGASPEDWEGQRFPELFPQESRIEVEALLIASRDQGEQVCQAEILNHKGSLNTLKVCMQPLPMDHPLGCRVVLLRDVDALWEANQDMERRLAFEDLFWANHGQFG